MAFAGMNHLAILVAAIAGWLVGAAWYGLLGRHWLAALGKRKEDLSPSLLPFIASALALLVMAYVLAGAIGHLGPGQVSPRNGIISGAILWAGFVATTITVNHRFQGSPWRLTAIDAGHWLLVLLLMGAVIGFFGV